MKRLSKWLIPLMFVGSMMFGGQLLRNVAPTVAGSIVQSVYADDEAKDKDAIDSSLYAKASDIANIFNQGLSALGSEKEEDVEKANKLLDIVRQNEHSATNVGNAGGALGYADNPTGFVSLGTKLKNWIISKVSANSSAYSYRGLENITLSPNSDDNNNSIKSSSFAGYAFYGKALVDNGYMKMGDSSIIGTVIQFGRVIGGMIILVLYMINLIIPVLFAIVLKLMLIFNPFEWVARGVGAAASGTGGLLQKAVGVDLSPGANFFGDLAGMFNGLYDALTKFGLVSVGALLGILIFSIFAWGRTGGIKQKFTKILLRFFIMVLGIPLLGGTYTSTLKWLQAQAFDSGSAGYINYVIASSFIRTDSWVENTRLAPPSSNGNLATSPSNSLIKFHTGTHTVAKDTADLRRVATSINVISGLAANGGDSWVGVLQRNLANGNESGNIGSVVTAREYEETEKQAKLNSNDGNFKVDFSDIAGPSGNSSAVSWVVDTLFKFMGSSKYSAATYDSFVKGTIHSKPGLKAANGLLSLNFEILDNVGDWSNGNGDGVKKGSTGYILYDGTGIKPEGDAGKAFAQGYTDRPYNFYNNGYLSVNPTGNAFSNQMVSYYLKSGNSTPANGSAQRSHIAAKGQGSTAFGLSDLAMYNFLNTEFGATGMTVYSPSNSSSILSLGQYQTVVMPGRGFDVFMLWIETVVILLVFVIVGLLFWYELITKVFYNFFGLLTNIFGSALGSLNFFMKAVLYAGAGLIQLVAAMVTYLMVTKILIGVVQMASAMAASSIVVPLGAVNLNVGVSVTSTLARILSIALLLAIAFSARFVYKKHVAGAIMEFFTEMITKFTHRLDQAQGGDGTVGQKLQAAGEQQRKNADQSDYRDALEHEKALDLEDRRQGKAGRSNSELRAAARTRALQTKAARMSDVMHGRTEDHALSATKELKEQRKDDLAMAKDETNEYRRSARELKRNSELLNSRDQNIARAVADYGNDVKTKGFKPLDEGFGDVDGDGKDLDSHTTSDEESAALAGIGDYDDLYDANTKLNASEGILRKKMAKNRQTSLEKLKVQQEAQGKVNRLEAKQVKTEARLNRARQDYDVASEAYNEALAGGNSSTIEAARARLDTARTGVATLEDAVTAGGEDINSAREALTAADIEVNQVEQEYAGYDSELDNIRANRVTVRRAAKHLARKNGFESSVAGEMQVMADGSTARVFKADPDKASSNLTVLRNSMVEANALNAQRRDFEKKGDSISVQRVEQQIQQNTQQRQSAIQNLANMGFDPTMLGTLDNVNAVGQQFEAEFNSVATGQAGNVVISGHSHARASTVYSRPVTQSPTQMAEVKTHVATPEEAAFAPYVGQNNQQIASLRSRPVASNASSNVVQMPNQTVTLQSGQGNTRRTLQTNQTVTTVTIGTGGVDYVDVVDNTTVTQRQMTGESRQTVVRRSQGQTTVGGQTLGNNANTSNVMSTVGVSSGYSGPAPIQRQSGGTRYMGTSTMSTDTTQFVQGSKNDTRRTIQQNNNVAVQHGADEGIDYIDVAENENVTHKASEAKPKRRTMVRRNGSASQTTYGPNGTNSPASLSKPKKLKK